MKTTMVIDDQVMRRLREEGVRQKRTLSELVESALRMMLQRRKTSRKKPPFLPSFHSGGAFVDVANREALYSAMESE